MAQLVLLCCLAVCASAVDPAFGAIKPADCPPGSGHVYVSRAWPGDSIDGWTSSNCPAGTAPCLSGGGDKALSLVGGHAHSGYALSYARWRSMMDISVTWTSVDRGQLGVAFSAMPEVVNADSRYTQVGFSNAYDSHTMIVSLSVKGKSLESGKDFTASGRATKASVGVAGATYTDPSGPDLDGSKAINWTLSFRPGSLHAGYNGVPDVVVLTKSGSAWVDPSDDLLAGSFAGVEDNFKPKTVATISQVIISGCQVGATNAESALDNADALGSLRSPSPSPSPQPLPSPPPSKVSPPAAGSSPPPVHSSPSPEPSTRKKVIVIDDRGRPVAQGSAGFVAAPRMIFGSLCALSIAWLR